MTDGQDGTASHHDQLEGFLWDVNDDLVEAPTQEDVVEVVCRRLVESEHVEVAWICDRPPVAAPRATAGLEASRVHRLHDALEMAAADAPWVQAAAERESVVVSDPPVEPAGDDPIAEPLSVASVPLVHRGIIYCVLTVAAEQDAGGPPLSSLVEPLTHFGRAVGHALATTEMQAQGEIFQGAIEQAEPAIALLDEDGTLEYVNTAFTEVYGYPKSDALGSSLDRLLPGEVDAATVLATAREEGTWREEVSQFRRGGERFFADLSVAGVLVEGGTRWKHVAVASDITSLKEREQRLQVLNRVLRHNLRNDIIPLQVRAEMIAEESVADPATAAAEICAGIDDIVGMSEKVRAAADALDDPVESERFALADLIDQVVGDLETQHDGGSVTLDVPERVVLESDWRLVELVVSNLVENALEHGGEDPSVVLSLAEESVHEETVCLTVSDDGPGIAQHELSVLERGTESALEHGSGLGLWLADGAVTTLGGELSFETSGNGTTVRVDLPGVVETHG